MAANNFSGSFVRTPSGGEGIPKVCYRRTSRFGDFCSQCSSMHSRHLGSAAGSKKWAYALSSGVCPDHNQAGRIASDWFEVVDFVY